MPTAIETSTVQGLIVLSAIDYFINNAMFSVGADGIVRFHSDAHQQLFMVRFLDFINEDCNALIVGQKDNCLALAQLIGINNSYQEDANRLIASTKLLREWIIEPSQYEIWLPTFDAEITLTLSRQDLLYILGNATKHNIGRLGGVCNKVKEELRKHGKDVEFLSIPLALGDFYTNFQDDYFSFYSTKIAKILTDIRWDLHEYFHPAFERSYRQINHLKYEYQYPLGISSEVYGAWFWELMNVIRRRPYIPRFSCSEIFDRPSLR